MLSIKRKLKKILGNEEERVVCIKKDNKETEITITKNENGKVIVPQFKTTVSFEQENKPLKEIESFFYYELDKCFKICNNHPLYVRQSIKHGNVIDYKNFRDETMRVGLVKESLMEEVDVTLVSKDDIYNKIKVLSQSDYHNKFDTTPTFIEKVSYEIANLNEILLEIKDWSNLQEDICSRNIFLNNDLIKVEVIENSFATLSYDNVALNLDCKNRKIDKVFCLLNEKQEVFNSLIFNLNEKVVKSK